MKTTILKTTLTAMTIALLSQPMFASELNYSEECFKADSETAVTIDANKFTHVWMKLHNNNSDVSDSQKHLQIYLESSLEQGSEGLDVEKFAALWDKAGNRNAQDHLTKQMATMVEKVTTEDECYHATDENTEK
jgi:hypothetical protein